MPSIVLNSDTELFYEDDWLGPPWLKPEPAILIHGAGESSCAWFGWVPRMAQQFRLLRPDLPGFGRSKLPDDFEWSVANLAAIINKFLGKLAVESACCWRQAGRCDRDAVCRRLPRSYTHAGCMWRAGEHAQTSRGFCRPQQELVGGNSASAAGF